jgi:hypothetical protein
LFLGAALLLAGCGGAGTTVPGLPGGGGDTTGRAPAITGQAGLTSGTASRLGLGRAQGAGVQPIGATTVELHRVDPGNPAADDPNAKVYQSADGTYTFYADEVALGTQYRIEAHGTVNGAAVAFQTLVSTPDADNWATPISAHVTEATTVAAQIVIQQILDLVRENLPIDQIGDLLDQVERYAEAFEEEESLEAPDFSDANWRDALKEDLTSVIAPAGSFAGVFGDASGPVGRLGALLAADLDDPDGPKRFLVFLLPAQAETVATTQPAAPPAVAEDEDPEVLGGMVRPGGFIRAESDDGSLVMTGTLIGKDGNGTWTYRNPDTGQTETGTWRLRQTQPPFGPYGGTVITEDGTEGLFAALYTDDARAFLRAEFDSPGGTTWVTGAGTVGAGGALAFDWFDSSGARGTGEGRFEVQRGVATLFGIGVDADGNSVWTFDASKENPFPNGLP